MKFFLDATLGVLAFGLVFPTETRLLASPPVTESAAAKNHNATGFEPPTPAPSDLQPWVHRGSIRWVYGPESDPRRIDRGSRMAAETTYTLAFNYRSDLKWQRRNNKLHVTIRRIAVTWKPKHVIWFRQRPTDHDFWNDRLVRHEMDHVRISCDPRLEKLFRKRIASIDSLSGPIPQDGNDEKAANAMLQSRVKGIFEDVSDLARIRYRELDRITRHGLQPLPANIDWIPKSAE
ncbi:MAG: hypothetical protein AAF958_09020 [Planctomycetota bacterium]